MASLNLWITRTTNSDKKRYDLSQSLSKRPTGKTPKYYLQKSQTLHDKVVEDANKMPPMYRSIYNNLNSQSMVKHPVVLQRPLLTSYYEQTMPKSQTSPIKSYSEETRPVTVPQWNDKDLIQSQYESEAMASQYYTASKYGINLNRPSDTARIESKEKEWRILNKYKAKLAEDRERREAAERRRIIEEQRQFTELQIAHHKRIIDSESNYKVFEKEQVERDVKDYWDNERRKKIAAWEYGQRVKQERIEQIAAKQKRMEREKEKEKIIDKRIIKKALKQEAIEIEKERLKKVQLRIEQQKLMKQNEIDEELKKIEAAKEIEKDKILMKEYSENLDKEDRERRRRFIETYNKKPPAIYEELYKTEGYEVILKRDEAKAEKYMKEKLKEDDRIEREKQERIRKMNYDTQQAQLIQMAEKRVRKDLKKVEDDSVGRQILLDTQNYWNEERRKKELKRQEDLAYGKKLLKQRDEVRQKLLDEELGAMDDMEKTLNKTLLSEAMTYRSKKYT